MKTIDQINLALTLIQRNHSAHADAVCQSGGNAISTVLSNIELGLYGLKDIDQRPPVSKIDAEQRKHASIQDNWWRKIHDIYSGNKSFRHSF